MRRLGFLGLLLALIAGAGATEAAGPRDGPGCLGVTAAQCVGWLRATMVLDEHAIADAMARRHQTDVNGRPLAGGDLVAVYGRLPERMDRFVMLLHLRPDDTVERVEANLLSNIIAAQTEAVYDNSQFYEIVWRLLGRRCADLTRLGLYRFFENSMKPRITHQQEDLSKGLSGLHRVLSHADPLPLCGGVSLAYTNLLQWRGGGNPKAAAKPTQFSSIELR